MQAVDVLVGVDAGEQRVLVEPRRLLDDETGAGGVGVELVDPGLDLGLGRGGRQVDPDRGSMPISAESLCLALTYQCEPGSSPTSTVPRPGWIPCASRAATRSFSSDLIVFSVAVPSRVCAVTTGSVSDPVQAQSRQTQSSNMGRLSVEG